MITILPIASGSSGNCMFADIDGFRILIDAGVSCRRITTALKAHELSLPDLDAVFITHSHSDHVQGLPVTMTRLCCPVYMSSATRDTLCLSNAEALPYDTPSFPLPGLRVTAFRTSHDCVGSVGYLFETEYHRFGYATDLGILTERIRDLLTGSDAIVLESNHDPSLLVSGPYPWSLKRRILSDAGHLSNEACAEGIRHFSAHGTGRFFLAHLSKENNRPELALETALRAAQGTGAVIDVLPVFGDHCFEIP